jgi:hypothetical protein
MVVNSSGYLTFAATGGRVGFHTTGPDAAVDSLSTSLAQYRATYTDGSVWTDLQCDSSGHFLIINSSSVSTTSGHNTALTINGLGSGGNSVGAGLTLIKNGDAGRNFLRWNQGGLHWQTGFRAGNYDWVLEAQFSGTPADDSGWTPVIQATTGGDIRLSHQGNGQNVLFASVTELTTIAAAATTDTAISIPVDAVVMGVTVRVTTAIPTAVTFTVTGTTSATQFDVAGGVSTAANTTDVGTRNCPYKNGAAQTIRITPNAVPANNNGRVRITIHYFKPTPPTS